MKRMIPRCIRCILLLIGSSLIFAQDQASRPSALLDGPARKAIVEKIGFLLKDNYVFPETGKKMAELIQERLESGAYSRMSKAYLFAGRLTNDLRSVSHDLHLRVNYDPQTAGDILHNRRSDLASRRSIEQKRRNYGFTKVERLPGNIGYLDLRMFAGLESARDIAAGAMEFLANSDAVIIDLRNNGGGSPAMVQFLCSYFFGPEPVHLNSLYWRPQNRTDEFWTLRELPGRRRPDVDLYILTSRRTFSGAEEFTYNLKNLKRAVIIGETTGGGAHPVSLKVVDENLVIYVPVGRAINPVTQTNWEGVGVAPDVAVPQEKALTEAHYHALIDLRQKTQDREWKERLSDIIRELETLRTASHKNT